MKACLVILAVVAHFCCARPAVAQALSTRKITDVDINVAVERATPAVVELRHQIHQHPELSNREFETSNLVAEQLRAMGLSVRTEIAHTGVVGVLKGALPGPLVAVRSELDALPVTEESSLPFKSTVRSSYNGQDVGGRPCLWSRYSHCCHSGYGECTRGDA
jgi:hypothetical protein